MTRPTPGELLTLSGRYWETCALHAAAALDLFAALGPVPRPAADLARELSLDPRALGMLLDALAAMGLAAKGDGGYRADDEARALLAGDSPRSVRPMIMHHHHIMEAWQLLPEAVRTGRATSRHGFEDPVRREAFLMGMFVNAMAIAPGLARELPLSGRARLLDLGGGPGTYAIHFCLENPGLSATVFDQPATRPFALATAGRFGVGDRVSFAPGDFLSDPLPGGFDAAWLSQILHGDGPADCRSIVAKAAGALNPGGVLFIHEFILDDAGDTPLFATLFALNMLVQTRNGQSYTEGELRAMMEGAGLADIRRLPFRGPNDSGILAGVKP
jgi:hypothetical protein